MAIQIQLRNDTAANWTAANPILAIGEMGVETDSGSYKIGDGTLAWNNLNYGGVDGASAYTIAVSNGFVGTEQEWLDSLQGAPGADGVGVPAGGAGGQVLVKNSNNDYDTVWADQSGGGDSGTITMEIVNYGGSTIGAFSVVEWAQGGDANRIGGRAATNLYSRPPQEMLGIAINDINADQYGTILVRGYMSIPSAVFGSTQSYLYVDPGSGALTSNPTDNIFWKAPVGFISSDEPSGNAVLYFFGFGINNRLDNINGINLNNPQAGDVLVWNANQFWENQPQSGGGGGGADVTNHNYIINSDFRIDQQFNNQTTTSGDGSGWMVDMWRAENLSSGDTRGSVPLDVDDLAQLDSNPTHKAFMAKTTGGQPRLAHIIEDIKSLSNTWVTLSFWYKINDANSGQLNPDIAQIFDSGDQDVYNNFPGVSTADAAGVWTKYTGSVFIPSLAGKTLGINAQLRLRLNFSFSSGEAVHVTAVKLEKGQAATPWNLHAEDTGAELRACQRYYWYWNSSLNQNTFLELGFSLNSDILDCGIYYPVTMRAVPSISFSGADFQVYGASGVINAVVPTVTASNKESAIYRWVTPGTRTAGQAGKVVAFNTLNAWIKHDARMY